VRSYLMKEILKTTALFIDADNVRLTAIPQILEKLQIELTPIKKRAYGTQIGPRQKILREHGVVPVEVIPVLPGKNSVDLVLTIDALEELFCGHADSIAIASGDSDFTPLALRFVNTADRSLSLGIRLLRRPCGEPPRVSIASDGFSKSQEGPDSRSIASRAVRTASQA
jgi:hypothetical protein